MLLRPLLPLSLMGILLANVGVAGTQIGDPIRGNVKVSLKGNTSLQGRISGMRWTSRTGRTTTQRLLSPVDFDGRLDLTVPMGEWTDVTLLFDGPVDVQGLTAGGGPLFVSVELDSLTVSFDEPVRGAGQIQSFAMDLSLPGWLGLITEDGAAVLEQGDPMVDRLAAALEDGLVLRGI